MLSPARLRARSNSSMVVQMHRARQTCASAMAWWMAGKLADQFRAEAVRIGEHGIAKQRDLRKTCASGVFYAETGGSSLLAQVLVARPANAGLARGRRQARSDRLGSTVRAQRSSQHRILALSLAGFFVLKPDAHALVRLLAARRCADPQHGSPRALRRPARSAAHNIVAQRITLVGNVTFFGKRNVGVLAKKRWFFLDGRLHDAGRARMDRSRCAA